MKPTYPKFSNVEILYLVLVSVLFIACKNNSSREAINGATASNDLSDVKDENWPGPDFQIAGVPIYEKFNRLEPLFHFDNDTTYVINFWATWCKPCIKELPYFEELNSRYPHKKVKVVLVSLDFPKQVESNLVPFVEKKQLKSKVLALLDGNYNEWIDKVSPDWSGAIPATYIYKGKQNYLVGEPFDDFEELERIMEPFL
ncbi:TlpA disulfide reductase family protein [Ulvibacterium sp.]|uniref:TlpA disulfide reductase family protein n=1 Tax=Ulvibacterium sp. TaxID=2665914 RepID=UPI002606DDD6|nr:TlpA disulfide reductase family protein [Ulvibacterium sp.]